MTTLVYPTTLVAGANENVNDLNSNLNAITAVVNGAIDSSNIANAGVSANNLATALAQMLGVTNVANTGRGVTVIATTEARTNTAYGTLTTPDQVTGIVLPTNGLLFVGYQATWQESVNNAARAAIFLGANQLQIASDNAAAPAVQEAAIAAGGVSIDKPLRSTIGGLLCRPGTVTAYTGDVTTGQVLGALAPADGTPTALLGYTGATTIFAAAGTYTVSVQFKASSGSVTAKNRKLWVWTMGFA